jgi:hypothetical protein
MFSSFCKHTPTIQSVIDNLSYCGRIWVHVHPITGAQVSNDALGGDFERYSG